MSRNSRSENMEKSISDGWDMESVHSEDEEKGTGSNTASRNYSESNNNGENKKSKKSTSGENEGEETRNSVGDLRVSEYFSRKLWRIFSNKGTPPPGGRVTPKEEGDPGPSPTRKAFSKKSESIAMRNMEDQANNMKIPSSFEGAKEQNISHYSNPAYIPSYIEEEDDFGTPYHSSKRTSYEAPIYSVNSAGHPVPITIEESENEDEIDPYSGYEKTGREIPSSNGESSIPTASRLFTEDGCCCCGGVPDPIPGVAKGKVRSLWRKTYKPDSSGMFYWLSAVTIAFLFNLWTIPLRATFTTEIQSSWQDIWFACDAICDLVFVLDIFVKFRTCYISSGVFISDLSQLNAFHRREWTLILDILAIIPTDLFFIQSINPYFRVNRLLKIHRVFKFYQLGEMSTWSPNLWRTLNLIHIYAVIVHYHSCFYYALSEANGFGQLMTSWSYPDPKRFPDYTTLYRRYTYSFYWCLVSMGIVGDRYLPETDWQFVFTIYLQFLGVTFMVILIGYVTVMMFGKGVPKFDFEKTMQDTRTYMKQRKLPKDLRERVLRFYQYCWINDQFPHLDEANMLRYLPISVRQEIELHSNFTALKQIPSLERCDSDILRELVMRLRRCIYLPGQFVYRSGDFGSEMYIVSEGLLQVVRDGDPAIYSLRDGDVFGEIDLLNSSTKRRTADVVSYGYTELYALSCKDVTDTLKKYPKFMNLVYQQEKRRQNMISNIANKECRAFGGKYQAVSASSVKSPTESKISTSKVHFRMTNGDIRRGSSLPESSRDESPDSGIPSTPSMGHGSSNSETPMNMGSQCHMKPELFEKITNLHQEHIKILRTTLDSVLYQEISYLQQRLDDTERERDMKAREISQLRRQLAKERSPDKSRDNDAKVAGNGTGIPTKDSSIHPRKITENNESGSEEKVNESPRKVIQSVRKKRSIDGNSMDFFGSSSTLGNA